MGKLHSAIFLPHPSPQNPKQGRWGNTGKQRGKADLDSNIPSKPPAGASEIFVLRQFQHPKDLIILCF